MLFMVQLKLSMLSLISSASSTNGYAVTLRAPVECLPVVLRCAAFGIAGDLGEPLKVCPGTPCSCILIKFGLRDKANLGGAFSICRIAVPQQYYLSQDFDLWNGPDVAVKLLELREKLGFPEFVQLRLVAGTSVERSRYLA